MRKFITAVAGAALLVAALSAPARADVQTFADVPADHWAYQAVDTLQKAGIVIGYPDGTYGGRRAMTRYEFAEAIARLLPLIDNKPDLSNYATKDDLAALRQDLENKLAANQDAIAALQKLVNGFQDQLTALGQDVAGVKDRLNALEARVAAVEEEQRRVKFTGALNLIAKAENAVNGQDFLDQNGAFLSSQHLGTGDPPLDTQKLLANADVYNDFVLGIKGRISDTATANVKLDFGNYLPTIGNTAGVGLPASVPGAPDTASGREFVNGVGSLTGSAQTMSVWEASLEQPVSLGSLGNADLVAGRFGNQWTKWTLMQVDADVYTQLYQLDSGDIISDGAKVNLKLGPVGVQAFAGQFRQQPFSQLWIGPPAFLGQPAVSFIQPKSVFLGQARFFGQGNVSAPVNQGAGTRFTLATPRGGILGASIEQFGILGGSFRLENAQPDPENPSRDYDRVSVYGVDYRGPVPFLVRSGIAMDANYTVAPTAFDNGLNNVGKGWRYTATDSELAWKSRAFLVTGGYRTVGPDYTAPGYWGKIGAWTNPTNISGATASGSYVVSSAFEIDAKYENYRSLYGIREDGNLYVSPLQMNDTLQHYVVDLKYGLGASYRADFGYEGVRWSLKNTEHTLAKPGEPEETYWNIGIAHEINPNTTFRFLYQILRYRDKGTGFGDTTTADDMDGNVAEGQFELRF